EGPAVHEGGDVYFSDISGNRILRLTGDGGVWSVFRADSGRTNGNTFDARGRLLSCGGAENGPGGRRRIVRTDLATGRVEVLAERFEGKRYNSPNDICVDDLGRVWFTDPRYSPDRSALEMDVEAVYRIDPEGKVTRVSSQPDVERPNGIAIMPDHNMPYLVASHPRPGGNGMTWAFDVAGRGVCAVSAAAAVRSDVVRRAAGFIPAGRRSPGGDKPRRSQFKCSSPVSGSGETGDGPADSRHRRRAPTAGSRTTRIPPRSR